MLSWGIRGKCADGAGIGYHTALQLLTGEV